MMRKIHFIVLLCIVVVIFAGCGNATQINSFSTLSPEELDTLPTHDPNPTPVPTPGSNGGIAEFLPLTPLQRFETNIADEKAVVFYGHVIQTEVVIDSDGDQRHKCTFKVLDLFKGELAEDEIIVEASLMTDFYYPFRIGYRYIVPTVTVDNVYQGKRYIAVGGYVEYTANDEFVTAMTGRQEKMSFPDTGLPAIKAYVRNITASAHSATHAPTPLAPYVASDDLEVILASDPCVLQVEVGVLIRQHHADVYAVQIEKTLRGNAEALEYVLFPKGSVKTGDRCIVIVQPDTEVGVHGTMAGTDNCVIPLTDTEKVAEIERLVEQLK